jgi:DNA-binding NarL/FixJ family response regulator
VGGVKYRKGREADVITERINKNRLDEKSMENIRNIRIFVVDDHPLFRYGLISVLSEYPEFQMVGDSPNALEALPRIEATHPDIVIMDVFMPNSDGIQTTSLIKQKLPSTEVIILTISDNDEIFLNAIRAGAKGYLLKGVGVMEIVDAIKLVVKGEATVSPAMASKLLERFRGNGKDNNLKHQLNGLSVREKEVLKLTAQGSSNKEIAANLFISDTTVKAHMRNILEKLRVKNRAEAVGVAISKGILNNN